MWQKQGLGKDLLEKLAVLCTATSYYGSDRLSAERVSMAAKLYGCTAKLHRCMAEEPVLTGID